MEQRSKTRSTPTSDCETLKIDPLNEFDVPKVGRQANCRLRGNKFIGVSFDKRPLKRPWGAQIKMFGRTNGLGRYATQEEAARAYDAAAILKYGPGATLNFPKEHKDAKQKTK